MNARLAIEELQWRKRNILSSAKEMSKRNQMPLEEAIDFKIRMAQKWSKTSNEMNAYDIIKKELLDELDKC